MISERLVRLRGTYNLRDTGGRAAGTGRTRWGKLYRSDALHRLDDDDRRELAARRIGLVVDLRHESERTGFPSALRGLGAEVVHVPVLGAAPETFLAAGAGLDEFYDHIVHERGHALVAAVRVLARSGSTPVIVHCTSGKDRTGLVVALALALVGVGRSTIVDDYAATQHHLPPALLDQVVAHWRQAHGRPVAKLETLVRLSPPAALERVFDRIEARHGSAEEYAREHGLTGEDLMLLADVLVGRPPAAGPRCVSRRRTQR
ncbi:tyrosine-protein phosphatase [Dactylosporangium sp. NPDC005572]|uniref:tyrosine-protein phosphatase n=1 Tax=Dactylosporangium sp. NPDC005572 TaxID=3156889 RepID=UPI0033BB06A9